MMDSFEFIQNFQTLAIVKNASSVYVNITQNFSKLLGWESAEKCFGKTDYEIPCKASEFADEFIKMDEKVIHSGHSMLALDIQNYSNGWKLLLVERNPIKNESKEVIGLFNQCIDASKANLFRAYVALNQADNKFIGKKLSPSSYILDDQHKPLPLTDKQENCLFLLIRGKSSKEIAKILGISYRTVESHIEAVKNKLACQHKSELIEKSLNKGFLYYIPKKFQQEWLGELF